MELVRLGDASSEVMISWRHSSKRTLQSWRRLENARDELGLEDRMTGTVQKQNEFPADCSDEDPTLILEDGNTLVGLSAPCKKMKAGRPSTSREKATYEYGCKQWTDCS